MTSGTWDWTNTMPLVGVDARRQPVQDHLLDIWLYLGGIVGRLYGGEGVDVHRAIDAAIVLLKVYPVGQSAEVISQVELPGGAHT